MDSEIEPTLADESQKENWEKIIGKPADRDAAQYKRLAEVLGQTMEDLEGVGVEERPINIILETAAQYKWQRIKEQAQAIGQEPDPQIPDRIQSGNIPLAILALQEQIRQRLMVIEQGASSYLEHMVGEAAEAALEQHKQELAQDLKDLKVLK